MRKQQRFTLLFLLITIFAIASVQSAQCAWTQISVTGTWTNSLKTEYGQTDFWHNDYQTIEWDQTITDFSGYSYTFTPNTLEAISRGFGQTGNMHVFVAAGFYVGTECRGVMRFHFDTSMNILGKDTVTTYGVGEQMMYGRGLYGPFSGTGDPGIIKFSLNTTNDIATTNYLIIGDKSEGNPIIEWSNDIATELDGATYQIHSEILHTDLYRETVTIKFFVSCSGSGTFDFEETTENIYTGGSQPSPIPTPLLNGRDGQSLLTEFMNLASSSVTFIAQIGSVFTNIVIAFMPVIGVIAFGYILDALFTSIQTSSVTPIGDCFSWFFEKAKDVIVMVYDALQGIAQAVDAIIPL